MNPITEEKIVLNVGGNSKTIPIPKIFDTWSHWLLDIDPASRAEVLCDAREMTLHLEKNTVDAVYCSHNLEHYYDHDALKVLLGFQHVLRPQGFVYIVVPDISAVLHKMVSGNMDIEDVLYQSPAGEILVADVLWGWRKQIEKTGVDFYAHKNGFTVQSLERILRKAGFMNIKMSLGTYEIHALAFKGAVDSDVASSFGV